jgi:hypothetical protein
VDPGSDRAGNGRPRVFFESGLAELVEFAKHEARLRKPFKEGADTTLRANLESAARRGVQSAIDALVGPSYPAAHEYLWEHFQLLDQMRGYGEFGPQPITVLEIDTANRLFDWYLRPHEVVALTTLDLAYRNPGE